MKYDNPRIRNIIDDCVRKILMEPDDEFFLYLNTNSRWELRLAQELYKELAASPSNCFASLEPALRYLGNFQMKNTSWQLTIEDGHIEGRFTISLATEIGRYVVAYDSIIPAGAILAIDYHFTYIQEKAQTLIRETEKRHLIRKIMKTGRIRTKDAQ